MFIEDPTSDVIITDKLLAMIMLHENSCIRIQGKSSPKLQSGSGANLWRYKLTRTC
jgi:hypothetical protein